MATKTGISSLSQGRSDLLKINPRDLHIKDGWNFRDMKAPDIVEHIDTLAQSIAEIGVKVPLKAYWEDGKAYITSGHCRLAASLRAIDHYKADLKTVPVMIEDRYANDADRILGQIVDNENSRFKPIEQARVFKKLIDLGWQQSDIAKKTGYSNGRISQILQLLALPASTQQMVSNGQVAASTAVQVLKATGGDGTKAEQELKAGLAVAEANGQTKVTATHMQGDVKLSIKAAVKEAFEYCDIDDSDNETIIIKMPAEHWEVIRKMCEL